MKQLIFFIHLLLFLGVLSTTLLAEPTGPAAEKEKQYGSVEERRLMESIGETTAASAAGDHENLESRKKELKRMEDEVDKKLDQLNKLRLETEKILARKDAAEEKRIQDLAKMYEKMSADKAAAIFGSIDKDLAIAILGKMKTKSAARILNNMDRDKAAKLTSAFSELDKK